MQDYPIFRPEKYHYANPTLTSSIYRSGLRNNGFNFTYNYPNHVNTDRTRSRSPVFFTSSSPINRERSPSSSVTRSHMRFKQQVVKGDSRIQYVPYEKKVIDYIDEPHYTLYPRKRTITDYKDQVKVDIVPREVTVTDYFAVQHVRKYIPQIIPEKFTEHVPVERKHIKYQYVPVQRKIIHVPEKVSDQEIPRYLGVKESSGHKIYDNVLDSDIRFWQSQYGYVRGESIEILNQKIRKKNQRQKQDFFRRNQRQSSQELPFTRI